MRISELVECYEEVIDSADTANLRKSISKNLREFQEYLEDERGAESLGSDAPWHSIGSIKAEVDAKIILPDEYKAAADYFKDATERCVDQTEERLYQARRLILALGYKAGLRRREALLLRLKDITKSDRLEVLVRSHAGRTLKSHSGNRRIPIQELFDMSELTLLNEWIVARREDEDASDYLFSIPSLGTPFIPESLVFDSIRWILQSVTGDEHARFHHLRHSFGTFSFWHWMQPRYGSRRPYYRGLGEPNPEALKKIRKRVLGVQYGSRPSEKVLYALSMAIGHSGPGMTLAHYIHSDEWMIQMELERISPELDKECLAKMADLKLRQVHNLAKDFDAGICTAAIVRPRIFRKLRTYAERVTLPGWKSPASKSIGNYKQPVVRESLFAIDIWEALQLHSYSGIPLEDLAERYCVSVETLNDANSRAKYVMSLLREGPRNPGYRHRRREWSRLEIDPIIYRYPRQKRHMLEVVSALKAFEEATATQKETALWTVRHLINNGHIEDHGFEIDKREDIRIFLRSLKILGFYSLPTIDTSRDDWAPRYRMTLSVSANMTTEQRERAWSYWGKNITLHGYQRATRIVTHDTGKYGQISLKVLSPLGKEKAEAKARNFVNAKTTSDPKNQDDDENTRDESRDWGFRLALYIIGIVYGQYGSNTYTRLTSTKSDEARILIFSRNRLIRI